MGIRHLFTFISTQVPNGVFEVDMRKEVENYRRNNNGKSPVIIIDTISLHSLVYTNKHEMLLGGRLNIYNERAHAIFASLKAMGVDLLFFNDGPFQENKTKTILDRRNLSYETDAELIDKIDNGFDLSDPNQELRDLSNITTFFPNLMKIAKEYGEVHTSTLNECDQEIAYTANKISALAILSHDTDFLIYEGDWHYWSAKNINLEKMTTLEFNRSALRAKLSLSQRQLSLLGTLGGSDYLRYEDVQNFHRKILYKKDRNDKFCILANYVRTIKSLPPDLTPYDENKIVNDVFHPRDRQWGRENLKKSLDLFCFNNMDLREEDDLLKKISSSIFSYSILKSKPFMHTLTYSNLRNGNFNLYQVISSLVKRYMGILLQHEPRQSDLRRTHFYRKSHETSFEAVLEMPRFPPFIAPQVSDLINVKYGVDEELDNKRWSILRFLISNKLSKETFLEIPKENFTLLLSLFFLVEQNQITEDEADCLLLSCNCPNDIETTLCFEDVRFVKGRDVELSIFFQRIFCRISSCIGFIGLGEFTNLLTFDGLYFHTLRKNWRNDSSSLRTIILNRFQNARIYSTEFGLVS